MFNLANQFHAAGSPPPDGQPDDLTLALVQERETAAADLLYRRYAPGIRFYLRRANASAPIDDSVLSVLLNAVRRIRSETNPTPDRVTQIVLHCTRQEADLIRSGIGYSMSVRPDFSMRLRSQIVNSLFTSLFPTEREVLMRTFLLNEPDSAIARATGFADDAIVNIRLQARNRFRQLCTTLENEENARIN